MSSSTYLKAVLLVALAFFTAAETASAQIELEEAFPNLRFDQPADFAADGLGYLYVVERAGRIYRFPNERMTTDTTVFIDIRERTSYDRFGESGFLGLIFHPDFTDNGYFYTYYMTEEPLRSVVSRWQVDGDDPGHVDPATELVILEIDQPTARHNAGDLAFGPDGYLYIALGDGSEGKDTFNNAQNRETLLGSILRIDVDNQEEGRNYAIPNDNPFAGNLNGYREEIYAYGLRNPWRFSIDPSTGDIWAGDVGESTWEEVDYIVKGGNYGWPIMEGPVCYNPPENCSQDNLHPPIFYYNHDRGRAVIGGFVYRGSQVPELEGKYLFAEWNKEFSMMWSISYEGNPLENPDDVVVDEVLDPVRFISTFGVDENQELYMLFTFEGRVMRFRSTEDSHTEQPSQGVFQFNLVGANPFAGVTQLEFTLERADHVDVDVYDAVGRRVRTLFDGFVPSDRRTQIKFDAGSLPNGVYFIRLNSTDHSETIKAVLAR